MPYIEIKTNIKLDDAKKDSLKSSLARAMEKSFPGKSERWLMVGFTDGMTMYFGGSGESCVMADVSIFGSQSEIAYDAMTKAVCGAIAGECGLSPGRIYVKYSEYTHWGVDGENF